VLHIADRLHRSACGSMEGSIIPYTTWQWKRKEETCKRCGEVYKRRKYAFTILKLTGDIT
jgi:hypothetical protein